MKKTNANRRLSVIMSVVISACCITPITGAAEDTTTAEKATTTANGASTSEVNPHSFKVGNTCYSFTPYIEAKDDSSEPEVTHNPDLCDYIVLTKTFGNVRELDMDKAYRYEIKQSDSWSYWRFQYEDISVNDITKDYGRNILKAIVHLTNPTEEELSRFDMNDDGIVNVGDAVFANQIASANPLTYVGNGEIGLFQFMRQLLPLASKNEYVRINKDGSYVCYGEIDAAVPRDADGYFISDELYSRLVGGAMYYGINRFRVVYSEEPIMYAYGIMTDEDEYSAYQILPMSYDKKLMTEEEYNDNIDKNDDDYQYVTLFYDDRALIHPYGKLFTSGAVLKTWTEPVFENFYLIPVDDNRNDILQCAGGSKLLRDVIAGSNLLNPPTFDEGGNEIIAEETVSKSIANSFSAFANMIVYLRTAFASVFNGF